MFSSCSWMLWVPGTGTPTLGPHRPPTLVLREWLLRHELLCLLPTQAMGAMAPQGIHMTPHPTDTGGLEGGPLGGGEVQNPEWSV